MERTPTKKPQYGSDPNIYIGKDNPRITTRKKRELQDSDSEDSISQSTRRYKTSCCSTSEVLNETLNAFREELKSMHSLLSAMKEEQEENYVQIKSDISEIKSEILEIKIKNIENEKIIEDMGKNSIEIGKKQQEIMAISNKHENVLKDLLQKNIFLEKYKKSLEERIRLLEQKEFDLDIELANVETKEGENVTMIVQRIAKELKLNEDDITTAWRIKSKNKNNNKPKPIIVSFRSKEARYKWLKSKKEILSNNAISNSNNGQRIYINERITRQTRQLFWSTKLQLKDEYQFIWIQNGKVLLRKSEDEKRVESVGCESDINILIKKSKNINTE